MVSLDNLKESLGRCRRADWDTAGPGALTWAIERVTVYVDDCLVFGCPDHGGTTPNWKRRGGVNYRRGERITRDLTRLGWKVLRFWECEVRNAPTTIAEKIVEALVDTEGGDYHGSSMAVTIANMDGSMRIGEERWLRLLICFSKLGHQFRRHDVVAALVEREGWAPEDLIKAWRTALHHRIIRYDVAGVHPGRLLEPCLIDLGLKAEKKKEKVANA